MKDTKLPIDEVRTYARLEGYLLKSTCTGYVVRQLAFVSERLLDETRYSMIDTDATKLKTRTMIHIPLQEIVTIEQSTKAVIGSKWRRNQFKE
ncbi:hypothetical protein Syun_001408 [Stephania yunnanensis]|uniref:Uncharacterized protein n=1 Tax=Stephania yunnanensis TaxID=152371 RepID=A0AAP0Q728_9MAGN